MRRTYQTLLSNQQFAAVPGRINQVSLPCHRHHVQGKGKGAVDKMVQFYRDCFSLESKSSTTDKGHIFGVRGGFNIVLQPGLSLSAQEQEEEEETPEQKQPSPSFPSLLMTTSNLRTTMWNAQRRRGVIYKKSVHLSDQLSGSLLADPSANTICALHKFSRNPILGIVLGVTDLEQSIKIFEGPLGMRKEPVGTATDIVYQSSRILFSDDHENGVGKDAANHTALLNYGDALNPQILLYQYPHEKLPSLNDEAVTTFSVPNLRTAFDTLQEQGLETEPFNLDPRDIDFLFEHPDGYVFRIKELEPDLDANLQ